MFTMMNDINNSILRKAAPFRGNCLITYCGIALQPLVFIDNQRDGQSFGHSR